MTTTPTVVTPPSHWYSSVWHFLKHVSIYVSEAFIALVGKDAAHTFAVGAESLLHSELGKIVSLAVQEVQGLATGAEKRAAAFEKIISEVKARGLEVKDSLIHMLIEVAVSRLKGLWGTPTSS